MTTSAVERIDEWESEPFSGGYGALHGLADEGFSGIVRVGSADLCLLNGTVVGILGGRIEDFEDGEGTVYEAPSPALPLLALMQDRNDEVKAKYYTEDTPISEVDGTLTDANFSGYIELSENVLSGDYYLVYYAGRSMAVAFVGNSKRLLTDDEAFERADGEVGIYQVRPAEIEPIEIPEPGPGSGSPSGAETDDAATRTAGAAVSAGDTEADEDSEATDDTGTAAPEAGSTGEATEGPATESADERSGGTDDSADDAHGRADHGSASAGDAGTPDAEDAGDVGTPDAEDAGDVGTPDAEDAGTDGTAGSGTPSSRSGGTGTGAASGTAEPSGRSGSDRPSQSATGGSERGDRSGGSPRSSRRDTAGDRPSGGADRLETYSVPSLDPSRSVSPRGGRTAVASPGSRSEGGSAAGGVEPDETSANADARNGPSGGETTASGAGSGDTQPGAGHGHGPGPGETDGRPEGGSDTGSSGGGGARHAGTGADARIRELEDELASVTEELDRVRAELDEVESERDELEAERDDLLEERNDLAAERDRLESDLEELRRERDDIAAERDELEAEVGELESETERLRAQLDEMEAEFGATPDAEQRLAPAEALEQTDIFVRYESKGKATLGDAHDGGASREQVNGNLGLEYHTQFDTANVAVAGQAFDAFLTETIQFRFITWFIEELLYEIRDTGKVAALRDVYDAIPRIDRAELNGTVNAEFTEDGQERRTQESFDVIMRDRLGNPLFVANLNDSRQAATESMMSSLVTASSHVGESAETLAGSFLVTSSFFEPEALETAAESTSGGLLSRDKRESFVKLSRKQGYHLCLVEAREGKFHLAVPEL